MEKTNQNQQDPWTKVKNYQKLHVVGQGAFGIVYLCNRLSDNAQVIMKQIPVEDMTAEERESALDEAEILSKLKHPNIIAHYANFFDKTALIIIMEYAEGGTLLDLIQKRKGRLIGEQKVLQLFSQIVLSLSYIHEKNILHRDIKTSNILLNRTLDIVKIGDFGISKILSSKSKAFSVIGTPSYISPELCENQPYNQKTDIWALGCILYEMMCLKKAFEAHNLPALVIKIMQAVVPPIQGKYSEDIKTLLMKLLRRDPHQRPNIKEVMAESILVNVLMDQHFAIGKPSGKRASFPADRASIVPGRLRAPPKASLTSLSMYLDETMHENHDDLPTTVYTWGGGILKPTLLPLPKPDIQITQVDVGRTIKTGITSKGRIIVWETSNSGNEIPGSMSNDNGIVAVPRFVGDHAGVSVTQVSCGDMFIACVTDTGILMTFGNGVNGCLGHGNSVDVKQPKIVELLIGKQVLQVACGAMHVMAVTADNSVFSWGKGDTGRLGHSNNQLCYKPKLVSVPHGYRPHSCFCGVDNSVLTTYENIVLVCGGNRYKKLAYTSDTTVDELPQLTPITTKPLVDLCVKYVALGALHSAFLTGEGACYICGSNSFGQLALPKNKCNSGQQMLKLSKTIEKVTCGDSYTVAVTSDGDLYTWGKGVRGRLGTGCEDECSEPKMVDFQENLHVVSIASNKGTTVVVTKEAT